MNNDDPRMYPKDIFTYFKTPVTYSPNVSYNVMLKFLLGVNTLNVWFHTTSSILTSSLFFTRMWTWINKWHWI